MVSQYLHEHLEALGAKIELGVELQELLQDGNVVTATLVTHSEDGTAKTETATFSYVIGADGGKGML